MSIRLIEQVVELTNAERAKADLQPLKLNDRLTGAALDHSNDMAHDDFFSHTGVDGSTVSDRVKNSSYEYSTAGENIAAGQTSAAEVVEDWMNSPGHRANILNPNYTEIGVGYEYLENDTGKFNYERYWTQVFGTSSNDSAAFESKSPTSISQFDFVDSEAEIEAIDRSEETSKLLMGNQISVVDSVSIIRSDEQDLMRIGKHESPAWSNRKFDGDITREITGDVTNFSLTVDIEDGSFDTGIATANPRVRVDEIDFGQMSSNIDVNLDGSGAWWVGPKVDVRKNKSGGTDGWHENYVIENASRTPEEYHERLLYDGGTFLGETNHDGATYNHYFTPHPFNNWNQFWSVRQDYRSSGSVDLDSIVDIWRDNGLPNDYVTMLRANIETDGELFGQVEMDNLNIADW